MSTATLDRPAAPAPGPAARRARVQSAGTLRRRWRSFSLLGVLALWLLAWAVL